MVSFPESLSAVQEALANNDFNLRALVEHYIKKINANKDLNAFNHIFDESALEKAERIQNLFHLKNL